MGWVDPRVGLGWVVDRKSLVFLKRIVYHVCNLCQTERFVDLQFDSGILLTMSCLLTGVLVTVMMSQ